MDTALTTIAVVSMAAAITSTTIAWHLARENRRRSDARIAALSNAIHGADMKMFATAPTRTRMPIAVLTGAAVVALVVLAVVWTSRRTGGDAAIAASDQAASASKSASEPPRTAVRLAPPAAGTVLELVALSHERAGDRLTVRGLVRNPAGGAPVGNLTAVVLVFDREGAFVTTGRQGLETATLMPGTEAAFLVTVTGAGSVGRYRVSFRQGEHTLPHVDTRS
jgi:hypothetical protein